MGWSFSADGLLCKEEQGQIPSVWSQRAADSQLEMYDCHKDFRGGVYLRCVTPWMAAGPLHRK